MSDSTDLYYAHMEADRNEAADAYFKARPGFGELEKSIFRAGFERAYAKLWPLAGAPSAGVEKPAARPCVWRTGCKHPSVCEQQGVCVPGGEEPPNVKFGDCPVVADGKHKVVNGECTHCRNAVEAEGTQP